MGGIGADGDGNGNGNGNGNLNSTVTHGQSMDHIESWLYPLFTPLAEWVMIQLKAEQRRLDAIISERIGDSHLDEQAVGSMAVLNEFLTRREGRLPEYVSSRSGSDMWSVVCMVKLKNGTSM